MMNNCRQTVKKIQHILVVDNSEVARTIVRRILDEEMPQAQTSLCGSGAQARALLEQHHFDLVTTSLMLPDMDGLDLCREIRHTQLHAYTPVIVVSGDADERLLEEGFNAGVTDYFDKALGYRAFVEFIKEFSARSTGLVGRVLYVEDSPTQARIVLDSLEKHGLQVMHTTSAEQAIELLTHTAPGGPDESNGFDIVLTDFFLKDRMTGGDLLHAIRNKFRYSQQEMPVLVITTAESDDRHCRVFHAGANDFVPKPIIPEILIARVRSLLLIRQQYQALQQQHEEMRIMATTDSLTGLRNKRYLLDHGDRFIADRRHQPVSAIVLDIDYFKRLNDSHGHIAGDRVLEQLGVLLREVVRSDTLVARFGGEEFVVLLPRCALADALGRAEALRSQIERSRPAGHPITVSIGVASSEQLAEINLTKLIAAADQALYQAKASGRNRVYA